MSPATTAATMFSPESMSASGKSTSGTSLLSLQSKMKSDPTGYLSELRLLICRFDSFLSLYRVNSSLNPISDPNIAKELGDLAMFLAHVSPFYDGEVKDLPKWIKELLENGRMLPSSLRIHLTQALILLVNRKVVGIEESLELFIDLQLIDDRALRKLAFSHIVHTIRRMNQNHRNEVQNRKLQNVLFSMLEGVDEARAKRAFVILCDLHRRKVWADERTANAICEACYHTSSRILKSALSFLLGYDRVEDDDSDESDSEDDTSLKAQVVLSRDAVYKAHHKGTVASKKKKKAKLQRVIRSMKRQQRLASENTGPNFYSPLRHLKDAQGFAEKLFSRLQKCNERFEVKMMMLKVIARAIGMHHLVLLNFYPYLQRYVQPHQQDITELLAAAVQACHYMVPPDAVEPLFKQVVNQFVHDRSRTEAIAVGLNVVREICIRMPLLMNEDLLQDLVLYKKSHEKAISTAARSLMTLFREICPSLLVKKDRGRPTNPKAKPRAFGEVSVASDVVGLELLKEDSSAESGSDDDSCEVETEDDTISVEKEDMEMEEEDREDDYLENINEADVNTVDDEEEEEDDDDSDGDDIDENSSGDDIDENASDDDIDENASGDYEDGNVSENSDDSHGKIDESKSQKRKLSEYIEQLDTADLSLRALKKLAATHTAVNTTETEDGILSNEDFQRIRELKAKKEAKLAMGKHGAAKKSSDSKASPFKIPDADQLSSKLVDPNRLEANIRRKMTKEQRLELARAGREERGKYQSRAAVKKKKTGGSSNKEKEHKKAMPIAAKRAKVARSRHEKKMNSRHAGKQFRGRKAWK